MKTVASSRESKISTSAIDKERALLNVDTSVEPIPVTHAPAHIVAPLCVLPEAFPVERLPPFVPCADSCKGTGAIDEPRFQGISPRFDALPNQYTPSSPYKSARINADSHKHLHEPVLPANSAPETVPNPGMLIVATETSPSPGGATSASCLPPPTNNFRKRVSTRNRQQASEKRRSSGSRSNFSCNIEGCTTTFTRWQNLKEHLKLHYNRLEHPCEHPGCRLRFNTRGLLRSHARHAHGAPSLQKRTRT